MPEEKKQRKSRTKGQLPLRFDACGKEITLTQSEAAILYTLFRRAGRVCNPTVLYGAMRRHRWRITAGTGSEKGVAFVVIALRDKINKANPDFPSLGNELIETVRKAPKPRRILRGETQPKGGYRMILGGKYTASIAKRVFTVRPNTPS